MSIYVSFIGEYEDLNKKIFHFNRSQTIESMLKTFLEETHSKMSLDIKDILFIFGGKILNKDNFLHINISKVFKYQRYIKIKIIDTNEIIYNGTPNADSFIKFGDYKNYFISLHKKLSEFFNENYSNLSYNDLYKNNFINFINSMNIDGKSYIIDWVNKIKTGTVEEYIQAYTGETPLCYSLNKWLRQCNESEYEKLKYFAGPFSYSLYRYAYNDSKMRVNYSKKFYRKMKIKIDDYQKYKNNIGELICYPAFTSTSEEDISKYNFPTSTAIGINDIKSDDISVVLVIDYICNNSSYPTPCVNVSYDSINAGEKEYIFPPFSFFRIENIEENTGKPDYPHFIYMTVPNKRCLIEFAINKNKTIYYNKSLNELYSS